MAFVDLSVVRQIPVLHYDEDVSLASTLFLSCTHYPSFSYTCRLHFDYLLSSLWPAPRNFFLNTHYRPLFDPNTPSLWATPTHTLWPIPTILALGYSLHPPTLFWATLQLSLELRPPTRPWFLHTNLPFKYAHLPYQPSLELHTPTLPWATLINPPLIYTHQPSLELHTPTLPWATLINPPLIYTHQPSLELHLSTLP